MSSLYACYSDKAAIAMELHQNIYFIDVPLLYDHILNIIFKKLKILPSWFFNTIPFMDHTICLHIKYFMHFIFCNIKMPV